MAKKTRRSAKKGGDHELVSQIRGSANQIWLAGLGAFADAQGKGSKVFNALVKQGEAVQKRATKTAEQTIADIKATASKSWNILENVFDVGVAHALHTLNVPTKKEFDRLARRVAEMAPATKGRSVATSPRKRRKSAHA